MKRICSWCEKVMSQGTGPDPEITYGICPECLLANARDGRLPEGPELELDQITSGNGRFTMVFGKAR